MQSEHSNLVIRAFEPSDIPAFTRLLNMPGVIAGTLQQPFRSCAERTQQAAHFFPQVNIVAELGGVLAGHACLNVSSEMSCRHSGTVDLVVRDDFWRQGIGARLMAVLLDQADNFIGLRRVELTVLAENPGAIALYEKMGFSREGRFTDYAFKAGRFVDAIPMARIRTF